MGAQKSYPTGKRYKRDSLATKARILKYAQQEFAAAGYNGARVDEIANKAEVNKNLIYHYFSSKESLYISVMENVYSTIRRYHKEVSFDESDPVLSIKTFVENIFDAMVANPEIVNLLGVENIHKAEFIKKSNNIEKMYDPVIKSIQKILTSGYNKGFFRQDVDPVELFISINALTFFYLSNKHTLSFILHQVMDSQDQLQKRKEHIVDFVISYLAAKH